MSVNHECYGPPTVASAANALLHRLFQQNGPSGKRVRWRGEAEAALTFAQQIKTGSIFREGTSGSRVFGPRPMMARGQI